MQNRDQQRANEFVARLAGHNRSDQVLDTITDTTPKRRETESRRQEARLVDTVGRTRGPLQGGRPQSRKS
jgi:hypothetical protein